MHELPKIISDPAVLLALEPEELGAKILFLLRKRSQNAQSFILSNLLSELWIRTYVPGQQSPYPQELKNEIDLALAEAWSWLVAQGLLVSAPEQLGGDYCKVLSRRAKKFENEAEFAQYAVARMLPKDSLNQRISKNVWLEFMRGEFDIAVFQAMKAVEVAVRETANLTDSLRGVQLMRKAFDPQNGPLTDQTAETGEKQARSDLFAGAIGSYKNPYSHRDVNLGNPTEAVEIILLANHLLRIVDARAEVAKTV